MSIEPERAEPQLPELVAGLAGADATRGAFAMVAALVETGAATTSMAFTGPDGEDLAGPSPYMKGRSSELVSIGAEARSLVERDTRNRERIEAGSGKAEDPLEHPVEAMELGLAVLRILAAAVSEQPRLSGGRCAAGALAAWAAMEAAFVEFERRARSQPGDSRDRLLPITRLLRAEGAELLASLNPALKDNPS